MNCEKFELQLDGYLDAELPPALMNELQAHAGACSNCRRAIEIMRDIQRRAFALPNERRPERDLWPGIAAQLGPRRTQVPRANNWLRAVAAAVALVAIFAAGMLADQVLQRDVTTGEQLQVENTRNDRVLPSVSEARRILPASHVELIEGSGSGLQQAAEHDMLRNLLVVNLAIRRVEAAVEQEPSNPNLRELLADLYARENRILIEAERLRVEQQSSTGPTRTGI